MFSEIRGESSWEQNLIGGPQSDIVITDSVQEQDQDLQVTFLQGPLDIGLDQDLQVTSLQDHQDIGHNQDHLVAILHDLQDQDIGQGLEVDHLQKTGEIAEKGQDPCHHQGWMGEEFIQDPNQEVDLHQGQ